MKRKIIPLVLVIALLYSSIPSTFAQEDYPIISVQVISIGTNNGISSLELLIASQSAYIKASDAASFCGYQLSDASSIPIFTRGSLQYIANKVIEFDELIWVPLESTMENLETSVIEDNGLLYIKSKSHTTQELLSIMDGILGSDAWRYRINYLDGFIGNTGVILSAMYNIASSGSNLKDFVIHKYDYKKYQGVFIELLTIKEEDTTLDHLIGFDKILKDLAFVDELTNGTPFSESLYGFFDMGAPTSAYNSLSVYKDFRDPIKYFTTDVGGLSYGDQLAIYSYISSIANVSEFNMNMLKYTLLSDSVSPHSGATSKDMIKEVMLQSPKRYLGETSGDMYIAAQDIFNYYQSDDTIDLIMEYINKECTSIIENTLFDTAKDALGIKAVTNGFKLGKIIMDVITLNLEIGPLSKLMNTVEKTHCISNIQLVSNDLYRHYSTSEDYALNAKYAALLYLRCCQLNAEWYDGKHGLDTEPTIKLAKESIEKISAVSDYDLTAVVENLPVDVSKLRPYKKENYNSIVGLWTVDTGKTNTPDMNHESLQDAFGSSIKSGSFMEIRSDGLFSYAIAAGYGGSGSYFLEDNKLIAKIIPDNNQEKFEIEILIKENSDGNIQLVMDKVYSYYGDPLDYNLVWMKDIYFKGSNLMGSPGDRHFEAAASDFDLSIFNQEVGDVYVDGDRFIIDRRSESNRHGAVYPGVKDIIKVLNTTRSNGEQELSHFGIGVFFSQNGYVTDVTLISQLLQDDNTVIECKVDFSENSNINHLFARFFLDKNSSNEWDVVSGKMVYKPSWFKTEEIPKGIIKVTWDFARVRQSPWGNVLGQLDRGKTTDVFDSIKDSGGETWYKIKFNGIDGYVHEDNVSFTN